MALRIRKNRRWVKVCLAFVAAGLALVSWEVRHSPSRHEFTTQRPGEPRRLWRSFRPAWTFRLGTPDEPDVIQDLVSGPGCLYYTGDNEAGCLEKSTGKSIWRYRLVSPQAVAAGFSSDQREWRLAADGRFVYACECELNNNASPGPYRLCALDAKAGAPVWEQHYTPGLVCAPCPAGSLLLLAGVDGAVTAVRQSDGSTVWQRRMAATHFTGKNNPPELTMQATGGIGVVQINERLLGFRLSDGQQVWDWMPKGQAARAAEANNTGGNFELKDGIVYALVGSDMVALQSATGRTVWIRSGTGRISPSPPVFIEGDYVFVRPYATLAALRRTDGATAWIAGLDPISAERGSDGSFGGFDHDEITPYPGDTSHTIFAVMDCDPVIGGVQRALRSVPSVKTVAVFDPKTGRERWRWQPGKEIQIDKLIPENDRLYLSDQQRVVAYEEAMPEPLPVDSLMRQRLIRRMMTARFQWPDAAPPAEPAQKLFHKLLGPLFKARPPDTDETDSTEAELTLLRLGRDSVSPLLDYIHHAVDEDNAQQVSGRTAVSDNSIESALDLLFDLDDPTTPPLLARELDRATNPGASVALAATLIRWGDNRALPALFRYVQSGSEERDARQDALYFVCRRVDAQTAAGQAASPARADVTAYLLARLTEPKAPDWLHCFAKFELLNDRGDAAYKAALATFQQERTAHLLPANPTLTSVAERIWTDTSRGFPTVFHPDSVCRDDAGTWWAAFDCDYPGSGHGGLPGDIWIVQSQDKKRWIKPVFGWDMQSLCRKDGYPRSVELACRQDRLLLDWIEERSSVNTQKTRSIRRHSEVTIADLYRDSDHDGLPDRFEVEIGTNPHNPDTNGNGIPDNEDKNPTYRPHALTEQEGIYQAVIEGLCQYGRWLALNNRNSQNGTGLLIPFGGSARPLVLPAPPDSTGVEILGHSGPVLFKPYAPANLFTAGDQGFISSGQFQHPYIDLAGRWLGPDNFWEWSPHHPVDPFVPPSADLWPEAYRTPGSFRHFFPYALSPDHRRARIGWVWNAGPMEGTAGYDIEVDKIGGRWLPVECREVYGSAHGYAGHATLPVAR